MFVKFIHSSDLPNHIRYDFQSDYFKEARNNKHYATLKRKARFKDTQTYNQIACLTFPNCIKFFVKYEDGTFSNTAFACYDWRTDTIYRFNNHCVALNVDNELFGRSKEDIISKLF